MRFNIVPLKGKKNTYTKAEVRENFPKWSKVDFYDKPIPDDANTMMLTGVHPLYPNLQIVVLDFDGPAHGMVSWDGLSKILHAMRSESFEPYMTRRTGNGGFHLIFICDTDLIFRNEHRKGLTKDAIKLFGLSVGDIDVRANGGLVFWECKFSDTNEYTTIGMQSEIEMTSSKALKEWIDSLRPEEKKIKVAKSHILKTDKIETVVKTEVVNLENCEDYGIPSRYFHLFNQLRPAVQDIWLGNYTITKGYNEFRKWSIFWRECLAKGIPEYVVLNRMRSGVQPEYDEEDTVTQLRCLRYKNVSPKWDYYNKVFPEYKSFY